MHVVNEDLILCIRFTRIHDYEKLVQGQEYLFKTLCLNNACSIA